MFLIVICFVVMFGQLQANSGSLHQQQFVVEPEDVIAVVGEKVVMGCRVKNKAGTLQWTRDDFGLGTDRGLSGFSRYRMLGEGEENWNLEITNVTLEDDAKFQCQVGATDSASPIRSRYATLQILSPPQPPVITAGPKMILKEGKTAMVQCISKGGKPAASIKWLQDSHEISDGVETKVETMEDGKRLITVSTFTFTASRNISGVKLKCEAENPVEKEARTVSTVLEVEYPPTVTISTDKQIMYEGDELRISCSAHAQPDNLQFQWRLDGQDLEEGRQLKELVIDLDRNMHNKKVSCFVSNKLGQALEEHILDVKYSPVFVLSPRDVIGDNGDKINLECEVDSNPSPSYLWIKNDLSSKVVGEGPKLSLILSSETAGRYTCQAAAPGFSVVRHTAKVSVRGPPVILGHGDVQFGTPGETVQITCEAESIPPVDRVSWSYQGKVLQQASQLYSMLETRRGSAVRSTLVIKRTDERHFGEYGCTVSNALGQTSTVIQLRALDSLPLLIIIAAVIGGLLLTVAIIVIFLTCRRAAKSSPADDWPPRSDKAPVQPDGVSNTSSDMKEETRTASSLSGRDDLDGSDSLPEYHANYIKSQPGTGQQVEPGWHGYGHYQHYTNQGYSGYSQRPAKENTSSNYASYPQYTSQNNLEMSSKVVPQYSNPYVLSAAVSPESEFSQEQASHLPARANSGRYNAVAHHLKTVDSGGMLAMLPTQEHQEIDLNESSIGTHV